MRIQVVGTEASDTASLCRQCLSVLQPFASDRWIACILKSTLPVPSRAATQKLPRSTGCQPGSTCKTQASSLYYGRSENSGARAREPYLRYPLDGFRVPFNDLLETVGYF